MTTDVARQIVDRMEAEYGASVRVGLKRDEPHRPASHWPLRIVFFVGLVHRVAVDVSLRRQGSDLLVRMDCRARTWIAYLKRATAVLIAVCFGAVAVATYARLTDARESWVRGYASSHARAMYGEQSDDKVAFLARRMLEGWSAIDFTAMHHDLASTPAAAELLASFDATVEHARYQRTPGTGVEYALRLAALQGLRHQTRDYLPFALADTYYQRLSRADASVLRYDLRVPSDPNRYGESGRPLAACEVLATDGLRSYWRIHFAQDDAYRLLDDVLEKHTIRHEPVTMLGLLAGDPVLGATHFVAPLGAAFVVLGVLWAWLPAWVLRIPCRVLRWPWPEEFTTFAQGVCGNVEGLVGDTLMREFGIQEHHKIRLNEVPS